MRFLAAVVTVAAAFVPSAAAQEAVPEDIPTRPKYSFLRFNEDWSVMDRIPADMRTDPWDALKYIRLNDDGSSWLSVGGHTRLRLESWSDFAFGAPADADDTFLLWRAAIHADLHLNDDFRFFVEGKSALSTERELPGGRRALDVDTLALEQAFADISFDLESDARLTLRPGRQVLSFGNQRLVSPLPWANTLRRWDGISALLRAGDWNVHGFWTQFAPTLKYDFNEPEEDIEFWGVYATMSSGAGRGLDLYYLGLDLTTATYNGTTGGETRHTIGARSFGRPLEGILDYDYEVAYQFGEVGTGDIEALMVGSQVGWSPVDAPGSLRIFAGFDYATGDDAAGGDVETFNHLFPLGHAHLGYIDIVGRQNIVDFSVGATCKPFERTTLGVTGHFFRRESGADALYNAGGGVVRGAGASTDKDIGTELDVTLKHTFNSHLAGLFGYSHFFTSDFIEQTGASADIDFAYVQLQYTF